MPKGIPRAVILKKQRMRKRLNEAPIKGRPWKDLPPGEIYQAEVDDTVRTKLGASHAYAHRLATSILALLILAVPVSKEIGQCAVRPGILDYIAVREGFHKPGSLPARLHNPGSLRFHGQPGAEPGPLGFAAFESDAVGWSALERDWAAKIRRHVPLRVAWRYL